MIIFQLIVIMLISYALGSVNLSIIISKIMGKGDIREQGSKNAGTTNTLRVLGVWPAVIVLIWDVLKGVIAVCIARFVANVSQESMPELYNEIWCFGIMCAAIGAILGHNYPVYFGFKGGKGVATSLGVILAIEWQIGLACLVLGISAIALTMMVSVGSLLAAVLYPILVLIMGGTFDTHFSASTKIIYVYRAFAVLLAISVYYRHRANIKRIREGCENRLSFKKKESTEEVKTEPEEKAEEK